MNVLQIRIIRILPLLLLLLLLPNVGKSSIVKFVGLAYDMVTFAPIAGKTVGFELVRLSSNQIIHQQTITTGTNGEVITPSLTLVDSVWYRYAFQFTDCNNDSVFFTDSLQVFQDDTLFIYMGICHSVLPGNCTAHFSWLNAPANPFFFQFTDASTGNPTHWIWSFGDGTTSTLQNPGKQYQSPGAYLVCLTISDSQSNCLSTHCDVVHISQGIVINADFNYQLDSFSVAPRIVRFTNESSSNITLNHFIWSFGDGTMAQVENPQHQFVQSGNYQVCLQAGYAGGLKDTACKNIAVPEYHNLWGQLFTHNTTTDGGFIQLINPTFKQTGYAVLDETTVDSQGLYYFAQRITHHYLLRALPDETMPGHANLLPTYPGNTLFWKDAALCPLTNDIGNFDITLLSKKPINNGSCAISGWVSVPQGTPYEKVVLLLLDASDDQPVAYTSTDTTGNFYFGNLPFSTYKLIGEIPGLLSDEILIELHQGNPWSSGNIISFSPTTSITPLADHQEFRLYPNPAVNDLMLEWNTSEGQGLIRIVDLGGKEIRNIRTFVSSGETIKIDISLLPQGVYMAELMTTRGIVRKKFVKIR